jgi:hypothetical protein
MAIVDDRNAARGRADLRHGVERDAVVGAVGGRRDDHIAGRTDPLLQQLVVGHERIRRPQGGIDDASYS